MIGEKVYLSTLNNELLEHATDGGSLGGLIPVEIEFKGRKFHLSEMRIIDLIARDAKAFVESFIKSLVDLLKEVKLKRIYPTSVRREEIRSELKGLTGFEDTEEAVKTAEKIARGISKLLGCRFEAKEDRLIIEQRDGRRILLPRNNPEKILRKLIKYIEPGSGISKYFVFQGDKREVMLLSRVRILGTERNEVRYVEPIGIIADFNTRSLRILRGSSLIDEVIRVLDRAIPVDEIYGLAEISSQTQREILKVSQDKFYNEEVQKGALKVVDSIRNYEAIKYKLGRTPRFFRTDDVRVVVDEPSFLFISSALLPEAENVPSDEVWGWTESVVLPLICNYEKGNSREPIVVSDREHFDLRSLKRSSDGSIEEERLIEVKTKVKRDLGIKLTREEFRTAQRNSDRYWLYLVYGAGTETPVILAVRNPLERLPFRSKISIERREEYQLRLPEDLDASV